MVKVICQFLVCFSFSLFSWADFNSAIRQQNAMEPMLVDSLKADRSEKQKLALKALQKIVTNQSLKLLVESAPLISEKNQQAFCSALGQMILINDTSVGEPSNQVLVNTALTILEEKINLKKSESSCFDAYAQLSPRTSDAKMEELFKSLDFAAMTSSGEAQALLALFYHRMNTFDPSNPADRYWFGPELKIFLRKLNLSSHASADVREAFARVIYLAKDEFVFDDYSKLLKDVSATVRILSTDLLNFVNKTDVDLLYSQLADMDYRVIITALENLKDLKKIEKLNTDYKSLLFHPQHQVRRALIQAIEGLLSIDEYRILLSDPSMTVRQLAAKNVANLDKDAAFKFAEKIVAGNDLALKKGIIDASEILGDKKIEIFQAVINGSDFFAKTYALDFITEQKIQSLYPDVLDFIDASTQEERLAAIKTLLGWVELPLRLETILSSYKNSSGSIFEYARSEIIDFLSQSEVAAEKELLLLLLPLETEWKLQNKIGQAIVKLGLGEFVNVEPKWQDSPGSKFEVNVARPLIEMNTTKGTMVFELYNDLTPLHVSEVLWGIEQGLWDQNFFHRVIDNFVAQASRPVSKDSLQNGNVRAEIIGLRQERGTLAMPRSDYLHSGDGGGFYINLVTNFNLDFDYTVFGKIVSGDSVLDGLEIGDRVLGVKRLK